MIARRSAREATVSTETTETEPNAAIVQETGNALLACDRARRDAEARAATLAAALERAAAIFDQYAELHTAKRTREGEHKAAQNRGHATMCRTALAGGDYGKR